MAYNITIEKCKSSSVEDEYYFRIYTQYGPDSEESTLEKHNKQWVFWDAADKTVYNWNQVELRSVHFGILAYCFSTLTNLTKANTPKFLDNLEYGIVNLYSNTRIEFKGFQI